MPPASAPASRPRVHLAELKDTAERGSEHDELVIGWEDTLMTAGDLRDAWLVLNEAGKWPQRIPGSRPMTARWPAPARLRCQSRRGR
jgi:hypothetical protein